MNATTLVLLAVAWLLGSTVVGLLLGRILRTSSLYTLPMYPCIRCGEPDKVPGVLYRCEPCEAIVTAIILDAALRGEVIKDPVAERRNRRSKGL
jgi:DNA-directed RNA polymerase subunit RPC12/RpoP